MASDKVENREEAGEGLDEAAAEPTAHEPGPGDQAEPALGDAGEAALGDEGLPDGEAAPGDEGEPEPDGEEEGRAELLPYLSLRSWFMVGAGLFMLVLAGVLWRFPAPPMVAAFLFGVPALILAVLILDRLQFDRWTMAIIVGGLLLYNSYLSYTGFGERNFDGGSQLEYIKYIVENYALPDGDTCFVCHHPPVYYVLAAVVFRFCELTRLVEPTRGVQLLSLTFIFAFIVYGALTVRRFSDKRRVLIVSTALITFWPYTIINSIRMHNDALVCTFMGVGLYYVVRWYQEDRARDMWLASVMAVLAVLTKSNGYILVAIIGVLVAERFMFRAGRLLLLKRVVPPLLVAVMAVGAYTVMRGPDEQVSLRERVLGEAYRIHWRDFTSNEPVNYLYFDLESFIKEPYVMARLDGSGRQYYWNHTVKSSLFATHNTSPDSETSYRFNRRLAEGMNFLLLAMIVFGGAALAMVKRARLRRYLPMVVTVVMLLAFHIGFKATIPSGHHNDFRFVYPLLIPLSLGYTLAAEAYSERRLALAKIVWALPLVFVGFSIIYYLPKFNLVRKYLPPHVIHIREGDIRKVKAERTEWDKVGNTIILGDEILEVEMPSRDVGSFEITVDNNDVYRLELYGLHETRMVDVGPRDVELKREADKKRKSRAGADDPAADTALTDVAAGAGDDVAADPTPAKKKAFKGLVRYTRDLDPPVEKVRAVRIWPVSGDRSYSVGHVVFKAPETK